MVHAHICPLVNSKLIQALSDVRLGICLSGAWERGRAAMGIAPAPSHCSSPSSTCTCGECLTKAPKQSGPRCSQTPSPHYHLECSYPTRAPHPDCFSLRQNVNNLQMRDVGRLGHCRGHLLILEQAESSRGGSEKLTVLIQSQLLGWDAPRDLCSSIL